MFHRRRWLGEIGSLRTTGKSEEGTTPVTATDIRGQLSGDHVSQKKKKRKSLSRVLLRSHRIDATARG